MKYSKIYGDFARATQKVYHMQMGWPPWSKHEQLAFVSLPPKLANNEFNACTKTDLSTCILQFRKGKKIKASSLTSKVVILSDTQGKEETGIMVSEKN